MSSPQVQHRGLLCPFPHLASGKCMIIERECVNGSEICSDEWPAYSNLNAVGYQHSTVNHQRHYEHPVTGAHTHTIERSWLDFKTVILKRMQGVGSQLFQSHLYHFCWKMIKISNDLFVPFLDV